MRAHDVYAGSDGDLTKRYYAFLESLGPAGLVAQNLFRAQKCSARAKLYRGGNSQGRYKDLAYGRKNWSMKNLVEILTQHCAALGITWGWKKDPKATFHSWVLYIDLPRLGQVSFHSEGRLRGPDYDGEWDGQHLSCERILSFCEMVAKERQTYVEAHQ